ncbi:formyltransferase family protein [Candidatus Pelagibacter sp.]|nr:formyltransferase family protein [Candidatus Pelagibacter sp.]
MIPKINIKPKKNLKKINIVIFGHGKPVLYFYNLSKKFQNVKIIYVITHKKKYHYHDIKNLSKYKNIYENIFNHLDKFKILQIKQISDNLLNLLNRKKVNLIISCGSRVKFNSRIIEKFKNRIFNFHPSYLPEERGGANFTYRLLSNKNHISATLHKISSKIDEGDILFQKKIKKKQISLIEMFEKTYSLYNIFFIKLINKILKNKKIKFKKQQNNMATLNPKILSKINGAIDWSWKIDDIQKFIHAFGPPYSGAFTFLNKNKLEILKSNIYKKEKCHPFNKGRVYKILNDKTTLIHCVDGILKIKTIRFKRRIISPNKILRLSDRLFTPINILERSLNDKNKINFG